MIKLWISAIGLMVLCTFTVPQAAHAWNIFSGVDCASDENKQSAVCTDKTNKDPITGEDGALLNIVDIVAYVAGIAAIIMIIIGGIYFMTANGDPANVKSARTTVLNAFIGLAVIVLARTLIVYVIKKV